MIHNLFPIPLYSTNIDRDLTSKENKKIFSILEDQVKNNFNFTSKENKVLNSFKELKGLKKFILEHVSTYVDNVYKPNRKLDIILTQSWLNITKKGELHHKHNHKNSIISGVFYPQTIEDDSIFFYNSNIETKDFYVTTDSYNQYNSETWWWPVKDGDLILFPSDLYHSVKVNTTDKERISLAFNIFLSPLGQEKFLTDLNLKNVFTDK